MSRFHAKGFLLLALALISAACHRAAAPTSPSDTVGTVIPQYARDDWQHWVDEDGDCQDTRQEVLIEESLIVPTLDRLGCRVVAGAWRDEYTGVLYNDPSDLDIDHRVPLANAHRSGGWAWDSLRKREYANDLSLREHLVAVGASVNRSKSDRGPEEWRPPLRENWCQYATAWRTVKAHWTLTISANEDAALRDMCL
jgi:hypothetical protein